MSSSDGTYPWGLPNSNVYSAGPTPYGNQWVIVGGGTGGTYIEQTVAGFTGQIYTLTFVLASEYGRVSGGGSSIDVSVVGNTSQTFTAPLDISN